MTHKECAHCGGYVRANSTIDLCYDCANSLSTPQLDLYKRTGLYPIGVVNQ